MTVEENREGRRSALDEFAAAQITGPTSFLPATQSQSFEVVSAQAVAVHRDEGLVLTRLRTLAQAAGTDWYYRFPVKNRKENRTGSKARRSSSPTIFPDFMAIAPSIAARRILAISGCSMPASSISKPGIRSFARSSSANPAARSAARMTSGGWTSPFRSARAKRSETSSSMPCRRFPISPSRKPRAR